jgi:phosphoglycerate-specific signal transduction histidine kinase
MTFYSDYVNNFDRATEVYSRLFQQKPFQDFMRQCMNKAHTKLDLPAHLIQPVQRMPRYQLLLRELIKHTDKEHVDYKNIEEALQKAQDMNVAINKKKKELEHRNKIAAVERTITGLPEPLTAPDRLFVRSGQLQMEVQKKWIHIMGTLLSNSCFFFPR